MRIKKMVDIKVNLTEEQQRMQNEIKELNSMLLKKPHILDSQPIENSFRLLHKKDGSYVLQQQYREMYLDWEYKDEKSLDEIKFVWKDIKTEEEK